MTLELLSLVPLVALLVCLSVGRRIQRAWQQPFLRYAGELAACGLPGKDVARKLLDSLGLSHVAVVKRSGFNRYRPYCFSNGLLARLKESVRIICET